MIEAAIGRNLLQMHKSQNHFLLDRERALRSSLNFHFQTSLFQVLLSSANYPKGYAVLPDMRLLRETGEGALR